MSFAKQLLLATTSTWASLSNIVRQELKKRRAPTSFYCLRYEPEFVLSSFHWVASQTTGQIPWSISHCCADTIGTLHPFNLLMNILWEGNSSVANAKLIIIPTPMQHSILYYKETWYLNWVLGHQTMEKVHLFDLIVSCDAHSQHSQRIHHTRMATWIDHLTTTTGSLWLFRTVSITHVTLLVQEFVQGSAYYPTISLLTPATVQDRVFPEILHQQTRTLTEIANK